MELNIKGPHFVTDVDEHNGVWFVRRPRFVWNRGSANFARLITKGQSTLLTTPAFAFVL